MLQRSNPQRHGVFPGHRSLLARKHGKRVLAFQGLAAVPRGKIDCKAVEAGFRKHTIANFNEKQQQLVVLLERGVKLHVTDGPVASLVDDKNLAGIPPLSRAGQDQEQAQGGTTGEGCRLQVQANPFQGVNAVLREAGGDVVTDDDRPNPRRHGCNGHPGVPKGEQALPRPLKDSVTGREGSNTLAHACLQVVFLSCPTDSERLFPPVAGIKCPLRQFTVRGPLTHENRRRCTKKSRGRCSSAPSSRTWTPPTTWRAG